VHPEAQDHLQREDRMTRTRPGVVTYKNAAGEQIAAPLDRDSLTLGRARTCDIVVRLPTVSRLHARIEEQHERYVLFDAGSSNGTFVNSQRIDGGHPLTSGDTIWLGSPHAVLMFVDPEETLALPVSNAPAPLQIDEQARTVQVHGVPTALSPLEYNLLVFLAHNHATVCTREECFRAAWGQPYDHATCDDALNACIAKLRRNLRQSADSVGRDPPALVTVPRVGFRLDTPIVWAERAEPTIAPVLSASSAES
jgi:DNA-binding winged helix-turn-helix (wHTH) protein